MRFLAERTRETSSDDEAGGREWDRPGPPQRGCRAGDPGAGQGAVSRDECFSASTPGVPAARTLRGGVARSGCSRTGPAFIAEEIIEAVHYRPPPPKSSS